MALWLTVNEPSIKLFYTNLPSRYFDELRWFADRCRETTLNLIDTIQFQKAEAEHTYLTINLFGITPQAEYFYHIPLLITPRTINMEQHPLFTNDQYAFYDAIITPDYLSLLQELLREEKTTINGIQGAFSFQAQLELVLTPVRLIGSTSNSLIALGNQVLIKNYRRLYPGVNPELRLYAGLGKLFSKPIPLLYGFLNYYSTQEYTLGIIQELITAQGSGWEVWGELICRSSLNDQTAYLTQQALDLGETLAELHQDLATYSQSTGSLQPFTTLEFESRVQNLSTRLKEDLGNLRAESLDAVAFFLGSLSERLQDRSLGLKFTIHGDLHLEQVLKTESGWKMIDFEGEPLKSITERECYDSPLKDLASLLRSISYRVRSLTTLAEVGYDAEELLSQAILTGYLAGCERLQVGFLPPAAELEVLVTFFQLERAVYECHYEYQYRPDWLAIPLAGLINLCNQTKLF